MTDTDFVVTTLDKIQYHSLPLVPILNLLTNTKTHGYDKFAIIIGYWHTAEL